MVNLGGEAWQTETGPGSQSYISSGGMHCEEQQQQYKT